MDVEVRVDPSGDRRAIVVIVICSFRLGWVTPHSRNDGQDSEGPVTAGSYEVTPSDRLASGGCPSRADGSS